MQLTDRRLFRLHRPLVIILDVPRHGRSHVAAMRILAPRLWEIVISQLLRTLTGLEILIHAADDGRRDRESEHVAGTSRQLFHTARLPLSALCDIENAACTLTQRSDVPAKGTGANVGKVTHHLVPVEVVVVQLA